MSHRNTVKSPLKQDNKRISGVLHHAGAGREEKEAFSFYIGCAVRGIPGIILKKCLFTIEKLNR
jgi:hypothetical protein